MPPLNTKRPSKKQWGQLFKILNRKEKLAFSLFFLLAIGSLSFLGANFYFENTDIRPASGGSYTEGLVGAPRFINPLYSPPSDTDRDIANLVYAGLVKYGEEGKLSADLAESYEIFEKGRVYEFTLKENLLWSDGEPLTAEDIIFTIESVQNPSLKSPVRANWLGVTAEKISDLKIVFKLKNPSSVFLENCTLGILPKHIWKDIPKENFPLSVHNLNPVGAGPYRIKGINQDSKGDIISLDLEPNPHYSGSQPNIDRIIFNFFQTEEELAEAASSGKIDGFHISFSENKKEFEKKYSLYSLSVPRYFALFFNPENSEALSEKSVRESLAFGTDKEKLVKEVLSGNGSIANSPVIPEIYGFEKPSTTRLYNPEKAKELLREAGFSEEENGIRSKFVKKEPAFQFQSNLQKGSKGTEVKKLQECLAKDPEIYPGGKITGYFGSETEKAVISFQEKYSQEVLVPYGLNSGTGKVYKSTRSKLNELCASPSEKTISLSFNLKTVNQPSLEKIAEAIKEQWKPLGININIETIDISSLEKDVIKPRDFEILLFGEVLGAIPDPYPFWHSSQIKDPGLNLSQYKNEKADQLLKENRQALEEEKRKEYLEEFQNIVIEDLPAIFLYNPGYLYFVSSKIKGIEKEIIVDSSQRFSGIENWYIKTKRVW